MTASYRTVRYGGIDVCYLPELHGGGKKFGQQFLDVVPRVTGRVRRLHEFCAGPAFIGFSLLAQGLCDELSLSDVHPPAVAAAAETVRRNRLADRVTLHLSDALEGIPAGAAWDLVVANPPHWRVATEAERLADIRTYDPGWDIHRRFYARVAALLADDGTVLVQENGDASRAEDFLPFIEAGGLELREVLTAGDAGRPFYFLRIAKRARVKARG